LDQANAVDPEWNEAIVNTNFDIIEMYDKKSVSYFKALED
jgi:hypothetical protein